MSDSQAEFAHTEVKRFELPSVEGVIVGETDGRARMPTARQLEILHQQAREEGYAEGHNEGYLAGQALANDDMAQRGAVLDGIISDLSQPLAKFDVELIDSIAELALQIARQLVRRELRADPGEVVGVVRETLKHLPITNRATTIRLSPEDVEVVEAALSLKEDTGNWVLEPDPLIARGGCVVETATSRIDASIESRTAAIAAQLFGGDREGDPDASS